MVALDSVLAPLAERIEQAEAALIEYSRHPDHKQQLVLCLWAVHHITAAVQPLRLYKAELLSLEMERGLHRLYHDKVVAERRNLTLGGLMRAIKVFPAYLDHVQRVRVDTGQGLEPCVNDLRRWEGVPPRPKALFFHMDIAEGCGISATATPEADETIRRSANVLLAPYLQGAKSALVRDQGVTSVRTVARIAHKMNTLFAGTVQEPFWLNLTGLCEGLAGGFIVPDECIAQIFKAGAFMIKHAREHGSQPDPRMHYDEYLQQMLYYMASCETRPLYIGHIWQVFGIDGNTGKDSQRGLIHSDVLVAVLDSALVLLNQLVAHLESNDLKAVAAGDLPPVSGALEIIDDLCLRLVAVEEIAHADTMRGVRDLLRQLYDGRFTADSGHRSQVIGWVVSSIVEVQLAVELRLRHGGFVPFGVEELERRKALTAATFTQMAQMQEQLQGVLQRQKLDAVLSGLPLGAGDMQHLAVALNPYLARLDQGHEELRGMVAEAGAGTADATVFSNLARDFSLQLEDIPERETVAQCVAILAAVNEALDFAGMCREAAVIDSGRKWLEVTQPIDHMRHQEPLGRLADAFACLEIHLERSLLDPLENNDHFINLAEQHSGRLVDFIPVQGEAQQELPPETVPETVVSAEDETISEVFREVFLEESRDIIDRLQQVLPQWERSPETADLLEEIRRHFHTFKGNGRAVGLNSLAEFGRVVQDMLDRVIDRAGTMDERLPTLLRDVVAALPQLVATCGGAGHYDAQAVRTLSRRCEAIHQYGDVGSSAGGNNSNAGWQ
ncbi:hypothetical protein CWI75_03450 [Kineobactrum sediminis]|uniref:HPt domain-containing protein n=2 Tax=Kineobactrum sediminis TaxID=1905677 RepID=A0A2N5Y7R4_9GAMM|nr:hypothetical protein CWI75_03450 [Kineobactrum sediminis]